MKALNVSDGSCSSLGAGLGTATVTRPISPMGRRWPPFLLPESLSVRCILSSNCQAGFCINCATSAGVAVKLLHVHASGYLLVDEVDRQSSVLGARLGASLRVASWGWVGGVGWVRVGVGEAGGWGGCEWEVGGVGGWGGVGGGGGVGWVGGGVLGNSALCYSIYLCTIGCSRRGVWRTGQI
jgi:hypothetical protein